MSSSDQQLLERQQSDRELIVRVYVLYRLLIASILLALSLQPKFSSLLNIEPHPWFSLSVALYLATVILTATIVFRQFATNESSMRLMLWSDILLLPLIIINASDFAFSIGLLLALSFLLGSLSLQHGYLVRALVATIFLLTAHWLSQYFSTGANISYNNGAILGLSYLMLGFLSSMLARHQRLTDNIVLQQNLSLKNQIDLNAFIIQQLHSGTLVVDLNQRIQSGNESAWRMLGKHPKESYSQLKTVSSQLEHALQQWRESTPNMLQESSRTPLNHKITVRFCGFGSKSQGGILITLEDQQEIDKQAQQIKLASLGKLTAGVAHEIRNPLSAIHQAAQLLEDSSQHQPQQMRLLEIIQTNTRRMNRQVEEILQLSRRTPERQAIQLNQWLPLLIDEYRNTCITNNYQLLLETSDHSCCMNFDAEQLRQVLVNLITNALQHSKQVDGERLISVRVDCSDTVNNTIIDVSDNGEAIPQEQVGQLFDPFFTTRNTGTGLGLYLSRELCLNNHAGLEYITMPPGNTFRISGESVSD